jgi:tetratricopeptide (TPR) repeat protein
MEDNTPHIVTDDNATAWWRWFARRVVILPIIAVLFVGIGIWVFVSINDNVNQNGADAADQKSLETNLLSAKTSLNSNGIVTLTTRLIEGEEKGTFVYSETQLADLYLDRASAYLDLSKFKESAEDFKKAGETSAARELPGLQGEVEARYKMGERKELIPLYQKLVTLMSKSENPMRNSNVAQYQENIQALQKGQGLAIYDQ